MSGIGFSELIILFVIGLIVLGPEKLPRVANQLGGWLGQARRMTRVMKRQLEDELNLEKELSVNPKPSVHTPTYVKPANELDDSYSPAHAADSVGTGVPDDDAPAGNSTDDESGAANRTTAEERSDDDDLIDDVDSAVPGPEPDRKQKLP